MSTVGAKHIRFGTSTNQVNSRVIPTNYTPTNYTPTEVASEGTDKESAHLKGIDIALGSIVPNPIDIQETDFSKITDVELQLTNEVITNLKFSETNVRSFSIQLSVQIDTTSDLWAQFDLKGIRKNTNTWVMEYSSIGDNTGLTFDIVSISNEGQVRFSIAEDSNRTAINMKFRAMCIGT